MGSWYFSFFSLFEKNTRIQKISYKLLVNLTSKFEFLCNNPFINFESHDSLNQPIKKIVHVI